ncbi:MAG: tetratricopeptide repeat protein [Candidatus Omnitrophota bacterium]|jgi:tetratricopeptide (TPR) repeat protein
MNKDNQDRSKTPLWQKVVLMLFGLFLTLTILEIGLRLGGFVLLSLQDYRNQQSIKQKGACRIMCLGESTTAGQYPHFLEEILNQRNIGIKFSVIDKGLIGTNSSVILNNLQSNIGQYHPDIVVAMIGINDNGVHMAYKNMPNSGIDRLLVNFRTYKLIRLLGLHIVTKCQELSRVAANYSIKDSDKNPALSVGTVESYGKAEQMKPRIDRSYVQRGRFYRDQGDLARAVESFNKEIEVKPYSYEAYFGLGWCYKALGNNIAAVESFKKVIEIKPEDFYAYLELGWCYDFLNNFYGAEASFKKAAEINPQSGRVYFELGLLYKANNLFSQAEESFKKAIERDPYNDKIYSALSVLYNEMGKHGLSREYYERANRLRFRGYVDITRNNYLKIKKKLDESNIKLVCVQYPLRDEESLRKIFEWQEGVIFVDNEKIFKKALRAATYKEYFTDMFAGDFGHCTDRGNKLLAENIADVILKEIFGK